MQFMTFLSEGFSIAQRHKRLVIVLWLAPLVPALVLAAMAASNLAPALEHSLFADEVLRGNSYTVWTEFRSSPYDALEPILTRGVIIMALLTLLVQVLLSAGVVETLLEKERDHPFILGVRRNFLRFARTAIVLVLSSVVPAVLGIALARGSFKLAEAQMDGRFDILGVVAAAVLFIILWAPLDLATDLSRIAAAHHDDGSMLRGFFRALKEVLKNPGVFVPLYFLFLLMPLTVHLVYSALRAPWTPSTLAAIVVLVVAQQLVMLMRAFYKLGIYGAEIAAFRGLDEPRLCRPKDLRKQAAETPLTEQATA